MIVLDSLSEIKDTQPKAIAIGTFDGLHRGHMQIINLAVQQEGMVSAVFTFEESPKNKKRIITQKDKEKYLNLANVEIVYSISFAKIKHMSPEEFIKDVIIGKCNAKKIFCGEDFRFGKNASGDIELLKKICSEEEIELCVVPDVMHNGERISSSKIRQCIENADMDGAKTLLGRNFGFKFEVVKGRQIGRTLGTPTLNQNFPKHFIIPKYGVYASVAKIDNKLYHGVTNVGVKPTVGADKPLSETWLPEFSGNLYGRNVRLYLVEFIREERKFNSLEDLKNEIYINAEKAKSISQKVIHEIN